MMEEQDRKRIILTLRWTAIIVTSYLILFGRGRVTDPQLSHILIAGYILSNVLLTFLPKVWFSNSKLFYPLEPIAKLDFRRKLRPRKVQS